MSKLQPTLPVTSKEELLPTRHRGREALLQPGDLRAQVLDLPVHLREGLPPKSQRERRLKSN